MSCRAQPRGAADIAWLHGRHEVVVSAPLDRCVHVLLDVDRYMQWFDTLDAVEPLERQPDGFVNRLSLLIRTPLGDIRPELSQTWDGRVLERVQENRSVVKNLRDIWILEAVDEGRARVTHELSLDHDLSGLDPRRPFLISVKAFVRHELVERFAESLARRAEDLERGSGRPA